MSVPISDYANEHVELANIGTEEYFPCWGRSIFCSERIFYHVLIQAKMRNVHFVMQIEWAKQMKKTLKN
jgi:hypothetical protein